MLAGLHGGTTRAHVARAALEGIAWRVADVVSVMSESVDVRSLRVDGGLTNEPLLLQLQADASGVPWRPPARTPRCWERRCWPPWARA